MKGPPEMCEPQVNKNGPASSGSGSHQNRSIDFEDYMWMGEEKLEDFDKKCEDEFWEDFLIQQAYEDMLADEEDLQTFAVLGGQVTQNAGAQEQYVSDIERHMSELNVNTNNAQYQGQQAYQQQQQTRPQRPRMYQPHQQQQQQQPHRQQQNQYRQPRPQQQQYPHSQQPQQPQQYPYHNHQQQLPQNYRQVPPPSALPAAAAVVHNPQRHQQPQEVMSAIPPQYMNRVRSSVPSGVVGSNYYTQNSNPHHPQSVGVVPAGYPTPSSAAFASAAFSLNSLNPDAPSFVPGMNFTPPVLHTVAVHDSTDR